jgi:osmotically-inducible protein OsmY
MIDYRRTPMTCTHSGKTLAHQIEHALRLEAGHQVHNLDVLVVTGGLILRGQALTAHAQQQAQHVAERTSGLPVVANEIEVSPCTKHPR